MNRIFNKNIQNKLNKIFENEEYVEYTPKELLKEIGVTVVLLAIFTSSMFIGF